MYNYRISSRKIKYASYIFLLLITITLCISAYTNYTNCTVTKKNQCKTEKSPIESINHNNIHSDYYSILQNNDLIITTYDIDLDIETNARDVITETTITYQNNGSNPIDIIYHTITSDTILASSRISTIFVSDGTNELLYEWEVLTDYHHLTIHLSDPIETNEFVTLVISYVMESAISESHLIPDDYIFQWSINLLEEIEHFRVIITLPQKFALNNDTEIPLEPEADQISIDGQVFLWNYYSVDPDTTHSWIIRFQLFKENNKLNYRIPSFIWGVMVVVFLLGGGIGSTTVYYTLRNKLATDRTEIVEALLSQPEKEIVKIIKEEGGVITQNKICTVSGFSKAKVSYYIKELENKEIIRRERFGRMNRIVLIEESQN